MAADQGFASPVRFSFDGAETYPVTMRSGLVLTAHALVIDTTVGARSSPPWVRSIVSSALGAEGHRLYEPLRAGGRRAFYPLCIVPSLDDHQDPVAGQADRVADTPVEILVDQLLDMARKNPNAAWRPVLEAPRPWLVGISQALGRVLTALQPVWRACRPRMAVEQARFEQVIGEPAARRLFLDSLCPDIRADDRSLQLRWSHPLEERGGASLTLVPLLTGPLSKLLLTRAGGTALGYPLSGAFTQLQQHLTEPDDRLEALLGHVRADILRRLDRPTTLSDLAAAHGLALSTASHHLDRLLAAGLIRRVRVGRSSWLVRTDAGSQILDLLG